MAKFTVAHEIHCNVETFWKTFFDKEFNRRLYVDEIGFPDWSIVEQTESDAEVIRKVSAQPKMEIPSAVKALFGSSFRYSEVGSLKKSEWIWRWTMTPNTLADKLHTSGSVRAEPVGTDRVRRIADMHVEVRIFGVGGIIESSAEKQLREGWNKSASYMNAFLKTASK